MTEAQDPAALAALEPEDLDLTPRWRPEALAFLLTRRSTPAKTLQGPGPDDETLSLILRAGLRAPDHGKLTPWRILIMRAPAQAALAAKARTRAEELGLEPEAAAKAERSFREGALILTVVARPQPSEKIPEIEQLMSAACVCYGLVSAALAAGFGANWLTGWPAHDAEFRRDALRLAPNETVAGFIHLGVPRAAPPERPRPTIADFCQEFE